MATPRSSSTRVFFHLNAYASTCAQYPNEYPNLAFHSSLAVVFSLFSILASLAAARPGKVQTLWQLQLLLCHYKGLPASLCALPSSLLGPDPFLYHPALLGPNHLSSLFSLLFSLFSRCCSFPRSHFATATSICASGHRLRAKLLRPFAPPSLARRNARSD